MSRDLPTPDQILEELSDKTAAQIDRLAPVAFDNAYREMTRYHRFLLALNASRTSEGSPFNFSEVVGDAWDAPHRNWIRQYARLFERAADRIPNERHFIRSLAYAPIHLLPTPDDPDLPPNVVKGILDLGPMMVHRLEAWVTKRTTVETREGDPAQSRLALAGSDAKAYANLLPDLVGAWETLLQRAPLLYRWRESVEYSDVEHWSAFRASWPFLWQHLSNTAYCLAIAVWNEDEEGAAFFQEALVRWPQVLSHRLGDYAELRQRRLLFPDILSLDWPEASAQAAPLGFDYMPAATPDQLFASVVRGAHDDVTLLTAALLLFWTINDKQASDIGGRTAKSLLQRENADEDNARGPRARELRIQSLLLDVLRVEIAGERFTDGSYGADLDHFVAVLDNMTERRVVPGRIFTPSTMHGREDLLLAVLAILAASIPEEGDDGVDQRIEDMAQDERVLPGGDRSLRNVLHELDRFRSTLDHDAWPQLTRGVALISPGRNPERAITRLREIISSAEVTIRDKRLERLQARPVDPTKLESIRSAVEAALLKGPAAAPFFRGVQIERGASDPSAELNIAAFSGIEKAQLVEPPMTSPSSGFEEVLVSQTQQVAGHRAWTMFAGRPRTQVEVAATLVEETFWQQIRPLLNQVGPNPVLVVSQSVEGRALRRVLRAPPDARPSLRIERHSSDVLGAGSYIATIDGVDVFGAEFPSRVAWLFSARALHLIRYAELDKPGQYVDLSFDLDRDMKGTLRLRFRQQFAWAETPTFEIQTPERAL